MSDFFTTASPVRTWAEVQKLYDDQFWNRPFVFRGQSKAEWGLETSIERTHLTFRENVDSLAQTEQGFLRLFQRRYHHYVQDCPSPDDMPEWLSVMQHYGAPTRLLDVTHSFFVALFFAIETARDKPCAVWAFDVQKLSLRAKELYPKLREIFDESKPRDQNLTVRANFDAIFGQPAKHALVHPLSPFRLNDRLTIQQGWFLVPSDLKKTFIQNLQAMGDSREFVTKVEIAPTRTDRDDMLHRLHRMNMNRATLFPGLGGFAESLKTILVVPNVIEGIPADKRLR